MTCNRPKCPNTVYRYGLCRKHHEALPHGWIPSEPTRAHVQALRDKGIGVARISELSGVDHASISDITAGVYASVRRRTHDAIVAIPIPDRIVDGGAMLPSVGTARRIRALSRVGHSQTSIATRFCVNVQVINRILVQPYVTSLWAARISDLYEELQLSHGPSGIARRRAEAKGWPPPLAWDDDTIDDPKAKPLHNAHRKVTFAERYQELREHAGVTDIGLIAERLNIEPDSVKAQIRRYREELAS